MAAICPEGFIRPFSAGHLAYLVAFAALAGLFYWRRKALLQTPQPLFQALLVLTIAQQLLLYGSYWLSAGFDLAESLPLHISRVSSLLGIYWLWRRWDKAMDVLFFFGLFAYGSFLFPSRVHPICHPIGISFLINHAITILLPPLAMATGHWRPTKEGLRRAYLWFLVYLGAAWAVNRLVDGNYFYLKYRIVFQQMPEGLFLLFLAVFTFLLFSAAYAVTSACLRLLQPQRPALSAVRRPKEHLYTKQNAG